MAEKTKDRLGKRVADLDTRVAEVAREQRRLSELLRVKDNSISETAGWIGRTILVHLRDGEDLVGKFKWSDKYQIAIVPPDREDDDPKIINKGAIGYLELAEGRKDGE